MEVRFNKSGKRDHVSPVDHLRPGSGQVNADGNDDAVAYMDVPARQVADFRVYAHDKGVADDKLGARWKTRHRWACRAGLNGCAAHLPKHTRSADSGRDAKKLTPANFAIVVHLNFLPLRPGMIFANL